MGVVVIIGMFSWKAIVQYCKYSMLLIMLLFACDSRREESQDRSGENIPIKPAKIYPCWNQTWECGDWYPLDPKLNPDRCAVGQTADGNYLMRSMCLLCQSLLIVDPDKETQRIVLSFEGRAKQCEHRWRPAVHTSSFDPIRQDDILFVIHGKQMYALAIKGFSFFAEQFSCSIAQITDTGRFPAKVDLQKLQWSSSNGTVSVRVGSRKMQFFIARVELAGDAKAEDFVTISYDHYYGMMGGPEAVPREPAHIAIVHKSDLANDSIVDLTRFRWKMWEDGLGNRCDSQPVVNKDPVREISFQIVHNNAVRDIIASPDGSFLVSTGDDGRVVIQNLDEPLTKIIGPFKNERLSCLAISRDGMTVLAGGDLNLFEGILKINIEDGTYREIEVPSTATMEGVYYCSNGTDVAYITAARMLSFFDLQAEAPLSSHKIFGGFVEDVAASETGEFFAVISMNAVDDRSTEPCKLTIFDQKGKKSLSHEFENCDEAYESQIDFLGPDHLVVCSPSGKMWQWGFQSSSRKWKVEEPVMIPLGPFSAIAASLDGKTVWLAKDRSVFGISASSGEVMFEQALEIGESKTKYYAQPIMVIRTIPQRAILAVGFWDGRIALLPDPLH